MLRVKRDGTAVVIEVDTDLPHDDTADTESVWRFGASEEHCAAAELVTRYMHRRIHDAIRAVRQDAYEQGWRDAKSKRRRKATVFANTLNTELPCAGCF